MTDELHTCKMELEEALQQQEVLRNELQTARAQSTLNQEKAVESNRLKSLFLAKVSHELRTPMNGVLGMLCLALEEELPVDAREHCELALQSGQVLLRLLENLLYFSRLETGTLENSPHTIDLVSFLRDFEKLVHCSLMQSRSDVDFVLSLSDSLPKTVLLDADKVRQILLNLVGNAFKFAHSAGAVVLRVEHRDTPDSHKQIWFGVSDTGVGIPETKIASIFEAFVQVDDSFTRNFGGVGLGLAIASELISVLGGAIKVESRVGIGSRFEVIVPVEQPEILKQSHSTADEVETILPSDLKVLVAEDNFINQKLVAAILEHSGCQVRMTKDGEEALQVSDSEKFDVILLDIQMPKMDGVTVCHSIRSDENNKNFETPIVALTANAMAHDEEKYLDFGMDGYVAKPIKRNVLFTTMKKVLGQVAT